MDNRVYWIWLSLCFSYGSGKPQQLVESEDAASIYERRETICQSVDYLTSRDGEKLRKISLERAALILERCEKLNIRVVSLNDPEYPEKLRHMYGAPLVLYVQGDISYLNDAPKITVVGTRKASDYGKNITGNLSYQLALAGEVIISGCAEGIDEYAHRGALKAGGKTVGVLGCGHDINYPTKTRKLKQEILRRGGALIGELPPGTSINRRYFPVRNRIMAGLSDGVVVTESPVISGSLITARLANDLNRDVFCVPPYNIYDKKYIGVIPLLREGAKAVFDVTDILEEYMTRYEGRLDVERIAKSVIRSSDEGEKNQRKAADKISYGAVKKIVGKEPDVLREKPSIPANLTDRQKKLYEVLTFEPVHVDDLTHKIGWACYEVLSVLTELELLELVTAYSGRRYSLAEK